MFGRLRTEEAMNADVDGPVSRRKIYWLG